MMRKILFFWVIFLLMNLTGAATAAPLPKIEQLGKILYKEVNFSRNGTQSCQTCHHHMSGFADPTNSRDPYYTMVSLGDDGVSKGGRNAPSAAYAGYSPILYQNDIGEYYGGMFWDGRATGWTLGDPLAEQAQGPPLNPVEMNMPNKESVVQVVREARYSNLFLRVFGASSLDDVDAAYDKIGHAIAAYERSSEVQKFSSRFDQNNLSERENRGKVLFQKNCSQCHSMEDVTGQGPLFTNYSFHNVGIPYNKDLADAPLDLGLGGFLGDVQQNGKFKVPTLRNIAMTAPYGHNGYFPTLRDMVNFLNTRDEGNWDDAEVQENLNINDIGSIGLTAVEVDEIVSFLQTLTDW